MSLAEKLLKDPARRRALVADANDVIEAEVASKWGLTGVAVKGGFKVVKKLKPGIIPGTVDALLDEFVGAVLPFVEQHDGAGSIKDHFVRNGGAIADALLAITDARAERNSHKQLVGAYKRLRPMGRDHVIAAMPRVGQLIQKHTAGP